MSELKLKTTSGGSVALTPEDTSSNITVTVPSRAGTLSIQDSVSVFDFMTAAQIADVKAGTSTNDTSAIVAASATGKYVEFPQGTYVVSGSASLASMKWFSKGGAVIKFGPSDQLVCSGVAVDVNGLTFEGPFSASQYTSGISAAAVKAAFDTPEYLDGSDAVYDGSDFTHIQAGSWWTLSLGALTGTTRRSFQSSYINISESDRYVIHVGSTPFGSYGNFGGVTILRFDSSNNYLGTYDPAGSGENLALTNTAKIKIRVTLRRTANSPATNTSTELRTDQFQFFKLTNDAASANLDTGFDAETHWQLGNCNDVLIENCTFRYMGLSPLSIASGKRSRLVNNYVYRCWSGPGCTNSTDTVFQNNVVDLRQLHTDGSLYNLKFLRHKAFAGTNSPNVIVQDNVAFGANWGIEFTNQTGYQTIISHNSISAEICGVSIASGKDAEISHNTITVASGFPKYGVEIPGTHVDVSVSHNGITFLGSCECEGRAVSASIASTDWKRGSISNNHAKSSIGVYISSGAGSEVTTTLTVTNNTLQYSACGVFAQYVGADIANNKFEKVGDSYVSYISNVAVGSGSTQSISVTGNTIQSGPEGVLSLSHSNAVVQGNLLSAANTLPSLVRAVIAGQHIYKDNVFSGTVPTSYYSSSGAGSAYSVGNRVQNGSVVLLGNTDERYTKTESVNGTGSPVTNTSTFTLPSPGTYLISVKAAVSPDQVNHLVFATFLLQNGTDVTFDANGVSQIGSTTTSSGSPYVATATMTASYNISTKVVTFVMTQSGGVATNCTFTIDVQRMI